MSCIGSQEREELLECIDSFHMAKIIMNEDIDLDVISHHSERTYQVFYKCCVALQQKYPYFRVRPSKNPDRMLILTITLPPSLKGCYKEVKKSITDVINSIECYHGEIIFSWHYNELHMEEHHSSHFHEVLKGLVEKFQELQKKEGLA